jgi:hypothetical protein
MLLKGFVIALVSLSLGFLVGSRNAPVAVDSQLAQAQEVSQDRSVRYVGYHCGDDDATVISREMPNIITECKESVLLSEDAEFPAPPRQS